MNTSTSNLNYKENSPLDHNSVLDIHNKRSNTNSHFFLEIERMASNMAKGCQRNATSSRSSRSMRGRKKVGAKSRSQKRGRPACKPKSFAQILQSRKRKVAYRSASGHVQAGAPVPITQTTSDLCLYEYDDVFLCNFIDMYRHKECLWNRSSSDYRNQEAKQEAYLSLLNMYTNYRDTATPIDVEHIKNLIRRLRCYYDRVNKFDACQYRGHIWRRMAFVNRNSTMADTRSDILPSDAYDCAMCSKCFKSMLAFQRHIRREHPPKNCANCKQNFSTADDLRDHLLTVHDTEISCPLCGSESDWMSEAHLSTHFCSKECGTCKKTFYDACNYRRHRLKCRRTGRFQCEYCGANFALTANYKRHSRTAHNEKLPFKCKQCGDSFPFYTTYTRHDCGGTSTECRVQSGFL